MEGNTNDMNAGKPGVDALVQNFVLRASRHDEQLAEICRRAVAQEETGGVCLPLTVEEAERLKTSPLVSSAPDDKGLFILDGDRLYTRRNWTYEQTVKKRVAEMVAARLENSELQIPLDGVFAGLKEHQREAIQKMAAHRFTIMTGGPGTGKTYTIARAVKLIREQNPNLKLGLAAPTGKAAARVKEAMAKEAEALGLQDVPETSTLHKLLGANYDFVTFKHNRDNPLDLDWLIVDEASMVSLSMMAKLLDALPWEEATEDRPERKCRLTLVGDAFQLSSVEPGQVFGDLCRMTLVNDSGCKCELTESNRFRTGGEIDTLARLIKAGDAAKVLDFLKRDGNTLVHYHSLKALGGREDEHAPHSFDQLVETLFADFCRQDTAEGALAALNKCRILCAVRKGPYGCEMLNDRVQRRMRKKYPNCPVPWMVTKNDSALEVSNGDVGVVMPSRGQAEMLSLPDGNEKRDIQLALLPEREKAFASTIHKAQGSEYENVIIVLPPVGEQETAEHRLLARELLYTALTRVKPEDAKTGEIVGGVHIFANDKAIEECCRNETRRNTGLA